MVDGNRAHLPPSHARNENLAAVKDQVDAEAVTDFGGNELVPDSLSFVELPFFRHRAPPLAQAQVARASTRHPEIS